MDGGNERCSSVAFAVPIETEREARCFALDQGLVPSPFDTYYYTPLEGREPGWLVESVQTTPCETPGSWTGEGLGFTTTGETMFWTSFSILTVVECDDL